MAEVASGLFNEVQYEPPQNVGQAVGIKLFKSRLSIKK
jgi:hypothetical protein